MPSPGVLGDILALAKKKCLHVHSASNRNVGPIDIGTGGGG